MGGIEFRGWRRFRDSEATERLTALLRENGGREAVIARGDLGFTPVPGSALAFD